MTKYFFTLIICITTLCNSVYCQYETIMLSNQVPTNLDPSNSELAFATADTGYMTYNAYLNNTSTLVYLQTVDSGRDWRIIDTVHEDFTVNQMCINDGRGAIVGSSGDLAAIELFNNSLSQKSFHTFPELKVIYSLSITDKDTIVFHGLTNESQTCLGKIVITYDIPQITNINIIQACSYYYQIYFTDSESGWYKSGSDLVYTEDLGLSESIIVYNVGDFDFYDSMHGVIRSLDESCLKFTEDGGLNWISSKSEPTYFGVDDFKMTSENTVHSIHHWTGTTGVAYYSLHISGNPTAIPIYSFYCGSPSASKGFTFGSQTYWLDEQYDLTILLNNDYYTKVQEPKIIDNISLFPIPASNQLKISLSDGFNNNVKISIINELGQSVYYSDIYFQESTSLDISNLVPGIYTLSLITENKFTSKRFIKM